MKFSLKQLLTLIPLFFLAIAAVALFHGALFRRGPPRHESAWMLGHYVRFDIISSCSGEQLPLPEDINRWLSGRMQPNHPLRSKLPDESARFDPWGRPYRCPLTSRLSQDGWDFEIYSLGSDGISMSDGNDPDDIHTGNRNWAKSYEGKVVASRRLAYALWAVPITGIIYLVLSVLKTLVRRKGKRAHAQSEFIDPSRQR